MIVLNEQLKHIDQLIEDRFHRHPSAAVRMIIAGNRTARDLTLTSQGAPAVVNRNAHGNIKEVFKVDIINPRLTASQLGNRWTIHLNYIATFNPQELTFGFTFEDRVAFWEWDDTDHDFLANSAGAQFRPGSLRVGRSWVWPNVPSDRLDTELGGEELRGQVFLRNFTTGGVSIHRYTPILQIAP